MAKRCNDIMVSGCRFILGNIEDEEVRTNVYDGPILTLNGIFIAGKIQLQVETFGVRKKSLST